MCRRIPRLDMVVGNPATLGPRAGPDGTAGPWPDPHAPASRAGPTPGPVPTGPASVRHAGPAADQPAACLVDAARLVRSGKAYSLAAARFPGMPLFPGHPPFQVLSYRTPKGLRVGGENMWAPTPNDVHLGCMTEVISSTSHSGAHIDALAHITIDKDSHWYGGGNAEDHLGDFGPTVGDAASLPPLFTRGVLVDAAGYRCVSCLSAGEVITAGDVLEIAMHKA